MPGRCSAPAEVLVEVVRQVLGAFTVYVENTQVPYAFAQQRVGHCRASATGTHLDHPLACSVLQATAKTFGKPEAIGVVADTFAILQHHGIHRADAARFVRQFVEQRDDRLLAREGDVQPGVVHPFGGQ